jgi:hypothetical protein
VSLTLPAGNYLLQGKLYAFNDDNQGHPAFVQCTLRDSNHLYDESDASLAPTTDLNLSSETLYLQAVLDPWPGGTVNLECGQFDLSTGTGYDGIKLTATAVGTVNAQ